MFQFIIDYIQKELKMPFQESITMKLIKYKITSPHTFGNVIYYSPFQLEEITNFSHAIELNQFKPYFPVYLTQQ